VTAPQAPAFEAPKNQPEALASLQQQAGDLLEGGAAAFERRLTDLRGHPIVVNKWASWCGPCAHEFPFFGAQARERAGEVAFIGVDSMDSPSAAEDFLERHPVPFPSYVDPDSAIAQRLDAVAAFPATAFYDRRGELAYLKQGGYASEDLLAADIDRYALGRGD
jgi:thiol-disulfide isomerase/thioredoxin